MATLPEELGVFDTETTGVDDEARIVTTYVARMDRDGNILEECYWIIDPGIDIPEVASDIHGVTTEIAQRDGFDSKQSITEIIAMLDKFQSMGLPIVAYNAAFDFTILKREAKRHGIDSFVPTMVIDGFVVDKKLNRYRKGKRTLSVVAASYGIEIGNAHDARADCVAAGKLAWKQLAQINLPPAEIHRRSIKYAADQAASLQEYFRKSDPSAIVDGTWPIRAEKEEVVA